VIVVEATTTRRLKPVWAFLASVFILGLGFVYVGKLRLAIATVATVYGVVALFSWTRLIVSAPYGCWVAASVMLLIIAVTAIGAAVVAIRSPLVAANSYNRWFFYLLWILMVFALSLTAYRIRERVFGYGTYAVPSVSMSPTVEKGEYFIADTWRYPAHQPAEGEIVVLELADGTGVRYLKRIVGLPGDRIEIRDRVLYRNGEPVAEPYIQPLDDIHFYGRNFGLTTVEAGKVFVLGDNRDNSKDSRAWGAIPINQLRGSAQFLWFSKSTNGVLWNRIGTRLSPENQERE
jgi:signal peptidase I